MYDKKIDPSYAAITNIKYDRYNSTGNYYKFNLVIKTNFGTHKKQVVYTHILNIPKKFKNAMQVKN